MEEFKQTQTFRIPVHFNVPVMNQTTFFSPHFSAQSQKEYQYLSNFKRINLFQSQQDPQQPSFLQSDSRKSLPKKRTYHKKNKSPNHNHGKWTPEEENLYLQFVSQFASKTSHKVSGSKRILYFKAMSEFIGTRNPEQCKSKDQKMQDRSDFDEVRRFSHVSSHSASNIILDAQSKTNNGDFIDQQNHSFFPKIPEPRKKEDPSSFAFDSNKTPAPNVDMFFNFDSKEDFNSALRHNLEDHPNYYWFFKP